MVTIITYEIDLSISISNTQSNVIISKVLRKCRKLSRIIFVENVIFKIFMDFIEYFIDKYTVVHQ